MLVWGGINDVGIVQGDIFVYSTLHISLIPSFHSKHDGSLAYNDGYTPVEAPKAEVVDYIANYGIAGAAAGILVVLSIIVIIVKCSEKKI